MDLNEVLLDAAREGNLLVLKAAIEKGADVNAKSNDGRTALMIASEKGYTDIVKYLIEKGAKEVKADELNQSQGKTTTFKKEKLMSVKELLEAAARKLGCELKKIGEDDRFFMMIVPLENNREQTVLSVVIDTKDYLRFISFFGVATALNLKVAIILLRDNLSMRGVATTILDFDLRDGQGEVPRLAIVGEQLIATADLDEVVDKIRNVAQNADKYEEIITCGGDRL
ncbi:MAG: ankyrin repeat domain-containing protein [Actinobacteria bacterium]|nr:ankyrin repeat domain-containing protein [Actinomycetota bacterium]